ncbi:MAG: UDP-N-acetylmuramoyl-L-alanyl-D-glutamate--2,6-diaminopimelate ligase [Solirubrobacteraceae bacterium]|nr:UDP-N-acetylmuramoyl-L-alanyl-D-glutamate--2,6-diaminopimelate ligase [Solirubrobacteraceae bacterium]
MRLGELVDVPLTPPAADVEITGLAFDNRAVEPGTLFFCVPGFTRDGHDYAADAIARGAAALVVERELDVDVPQVRVPSARAAMAPVAARFCGDPTARLTVVGVTGTNGKTTSCFLIRELLEAGGIPTALLGTVKSVVGGREAPLERTTPEAIELQRAFAAMLDAGDRACAMEVSSHALELHRVDAIHWSVAVFTNLTQDHLDFHPTMEDYFRAKRRLFERAAEAGATLVVNVDDPYGRRLAADFPQAVTTGIEHAADVRATDVRSTLTGSAFRVDGVEVRTPLPGRFNVANVLGAVAAARAAGVDEAVIRAALPRAGRVPGRFEPVDEGQGFAVLVDYAHTPDSLENVLRAARELTDGRVIVAFGAGGDRDRGKRPLMGRAAAALADEVIVTSDNPRSEDPDAIIAEILAGIDDRDRVRTEPDRARAIAVAVDLARDGDVVVVAGKGHEQGQELAGGRTIPFDDVTVAREALRARLVA